MPEINYKLGDIVELRSNLGKELKAMPKPRTGEIKNINGFYILVKPTGKDWVQEFYRNEIRPLKVMK